MKYQNIVEGRFLNRPNRFIAEVEIDGNRQTVHVKNTGRCRELLIPGARIGLEHCPAAGRKTDYDLVSVYKENIGWINIDSQACNKAMKEWLMQHSLASVCSEKTCGSSRFDFCLEQDEKSLWLEVKGCTLEIDGVGYFPDAPTVRGARHLKELSEMAKAGTRCAVCFVIAVNGIRQCLPNEKTDQKFTDAFYDALEAGVEIYHAACFCSMDEVRIESVFRQRTKGLEEVERIEL